MIYKYLSILICIVSTLCSSVFSQRLTSNCSTKTANCTGDQIYYCFPNPLNNGCYPRVNCISGSFVAITPPATNSSLGPSLTCKKCSQGQTTNTTNSLKCYEVCPDGQTMLEGNVVGDARCTEKRKKLNYETVIFIICGIVGFFLLCIITWRCVRYSKCYRQQVHTAKDRRHACAAFCVRHFCPECYTRQNYRTDGDNPTATGNTQRDAHTSGTARTSEQDGFRNPAFSETSIDRY